jgi:chromosome segregation ATPase
VVCAERAHWQHRHDAAQHRRKAISTEMHTQRNECTRLERTLRTKQASEAQAAGERLALQQSLNALERERDELALELADVKGAVADSERTKSVLAELAQKLHSTTAEHEAALARREELSAELASNAEATERALKAVEIASREVAAAQEALVAMREGAAGQSRDQFVNHALQILKTLAASLNSKTATPDQVRLLVHKAGRLLSHAAESNAGEVMAAVKSAQKRLETAMAKRETAVEHQTNITIKGRSLEIDLSHADESVRRLEETVAKLKTEIEPLEKSTAGHAGTHAQADRIAGALAAAGEHLEAQREKVRALASAGDNGRCRRRTIHRPRPRARRDQRSLQGRCGGSCRVGPLCRGPGSARIARGAARPAGARRGSTRSPLRHAPRADHRIPRRKNPALGALCANRRPRSRRSRPPRRNR